jgi:transposase, IS30 family
MSYNHLTMEERYHIQALKSVGYKQYEIAKELNRDKGTISRELQRNSSSQTQRYSAKAANSVCRDRRMYASRSSNKKMCPEVEAWVSYYILDDYSPEQTAAILNIRNNIDISLVRIYQFVEEDRCLGGDLHKHLRFYHTGKRRAKYGMKYKGKVTGRVSISQRPDIVDEKIRIGDFEIDTIVGSNQKGAITTAIDRVSYLTKISIPTTKEASAVEAELTRILSPIKDKIITITSDNGLEFSNHKNISQSLECDYYFCHPYSSWERGLNEYTNGLIRQYIPKGTSFKGITQEYIQMIEDKLNNRPRKALNWLTPNEAFYGVKQVA